MRRVTHRTPNLAAYAGKWVVLSNSHVVASAPSLREALQKVSAKGKVLKPAVFLVPRKDEGPYVLVIVPVGC